MIKGQGSVQAISQLRLKGSNLPKHYGADVCCSMSSLMHCKLKVNIFRRQFLRGLFVCQLLARWPFVPHPDIWAVWTWCLYFCDTDQFLYPSEPEDKGRNVFLALLFICFLLNLRFFLLTYLRYFCQNRSYVKVTSQI